MSIRKTAFTWTDLELKLVEYFNLRASDTRGRERLAAEIWAALAQSWLEGVITPEEPDGDEEDDEQVQDSVDLIGGKRPRPAAKSAGKARPTVCQPSLMSAVFKRQLRNLSAGQALVALNGGRVTAALPELEQAYMEESLYKHRRPVVLNDQVQRYTFITPMFEDYMDHRSRGNPVNLQGYVAKGIAFFLQELRDTVLSGELRTHKLELELSRLQRQTPPPMPKDIEEAQLKLRKHLDALATGEFHRDSPYVKRLALAELWLKVLTHAQRWGAHWAACAQPGGPARTDATWQELRKELEGFQAEKMSNKPGKSGKKTSKESSNTPTTDPATAYLQRMAELEAAGSGPTAAELAQVRQEVAQCEYKLNRLKGLVRHSGETLASDHTGALPGDQNAQEHMDRLSHEAAGLANPLQRPAILTPETVLQHQQRMDQLLALIAALPEPQRRLAELVLLSDGDDPPSGNELARELGVSPNNQLIKQRHTVLQALWAQL